MQMTTETITYKARSYYGEAEVMHSWTITDEDGVAAELYADYTTGQIMQVEVREDRRGEGLARALYETASDQITLYHSPDEHCTPAGLAFKEAIGGETVPAESAYIPE